MLQIKNLSTINLINVNFTVESGQCVCIYGESGSGKTRLLRAIADLDISQGEVFIHHSAKSQMPANDWRRQVTFLPAESHWWRDYVADHFEHFSPDYSSLGLPSEIGAWRIDRLSTGEKQRLSLLRALNHDPAFLLLDETTANLDAENTHRVEVLIKDKLLNGLGVVWVSHSEEQRQRMADISYQIQNGQLS